PPVPTTSIFSRTDGVVSWQCCVEKEGPAAENIEVEASHLGMGFNPMVLYAVADRLAQPEGGWQPFDRAGVRALLYRDPRRKTWY
ncbi:MAG: alpha/beta hydrolase, partial [Burkholderiaceae bacterium]|nr:alpha/beta hydrolase [Burkholderiaceae bacterium]